MRFIGILAYPKKVLDYKIFNDHATFSHISHKLCHAFLTNYFNLSKHLSNPVNKGELLAFINTMIL